MPKRDYYEVLEITKDATEADIKKAYRKQALKYHPDKNPDNKESEASFKESAEAYEVLSDQNKKQHYDQFGHAGIGRNGFSGGGGGGMNMDDIFSNFGDIFGSTFGGFNGFNNSRRQRINRGSNLRVKVNLTLEDIFNGVEKKIKLNKYITCKKCKGSGAKDGSYSSCPTCHGTGQVTRITNTIIGQMQTASPCPHCGGEGQIITHKCSECAGNGIIESEETISMKIPAGVVQGMQISISGKGNAGARNGIPGDLIILIEETPHPDLIRDGSNLLNDLYISFPEASLGCSVEIPTINGKVRIKINPGTQPGKVLRLKGKGLPDVNVHGRGDILVNINVWTPKKLSEEEKIILEKLSSSKNFEPQPTSKDKSFFDRMREYFS